MKLKRQAFTAGTYPLSLLTSPHFDPFLQSRIWTQRMLLPIVGTPPKLLRQSARDPMSWVIPHPNKLTTEISHPKGLTLNAGGTTAWAGLKTEEKWESELNISIHLSLLPPCTCDVSRDPAACCHAVYTMRDFTLKLWGKINIPLRRFCWSFFYNEKSN